MVKAIDFVVRDSAGGVVRGSVAGDTGGTFVQMGMGEEISLNLAPQTVTSYAKDGDDLLITLVDGRQIVLDGYFNAVGEANQLYLSQNGDIVAVELSTGSNGTLIAGYGPSDGWDKFSSLDDLRFSETDDLALALGATDEPAGMAAFIPGLLGAGGTAGLVGIGTIGLIGGGGGGGDGGRRPPTVNDPTSSQTVTTESTDQTLNVSGTGQPGDRVVVTIGTVTQETTITTEGTWAVEFVGTNRPADGTYETSVLFRHVDINTTTTLDGPTFILDLTPPPVEVTDGAKSTGDIENAAEYADGVTISGEGEAGASIVVQIGTFTQTTTVTAGGTWTVTFPTTQVQPGEYEIPFTVTATDALGNDTRIEDVLVVDTVPHPIVFNPVTADNTVSGAENTGGFQISGTSTAGATLSITLQGVTQTVTVGANGVWTASYTAGTLTAGEYDATVTATTTDAAGNASTATHTFRVDTATTVAFAPGPVTADGIVNMFEANTGVTLTGTAQAGATVQVAWNGTTLPATVAANGNWSVTFPSSGVPAGTYSSTATVTATDAFGNTATATRSIAVDTETSVSFNNGQSGGDDIISGTERNGGAVITGRAEAGATVEVTIEGATRTVTANAQGVWSATFAPGDVPTGTYATMMSVSATDAAGNVALSERGIQVDTEVVPFAIEDVETGADAVVNAAEAAGGVTITGIAEHGSTVMVQFGTGAAAPATVAFDGSWSITIPANRIPSGESTVPVTVTATDAVGNVATVTQDVQVDTVVRNFHRTGGEIAGDGVLNAAEAAAGVTFAGTVEPNSTVVVRLSNGEEMTVTAGSSGSWTVTFPQDSLPTGEGTATVTMTATDPAGNVATLSEDFDFDTASPDALQTMKIVRDGQEVTGIYTNPDSETVTLHRVDANGVASEVDHDVNQNITTIIDGRRVTVDGYEFANGVPDGSYLVIGNTDAAGNETSTLLIVNNTNTVTVDLDRAGLSGFDFGAIDLTFAPQASLTITASDLQNLTGADQELIVRGDADDRVSLDNATAGGSRVIDGQTFNIYTLGTGTVLVDDDIQTSVI